MNSIIVLFLQYMKSKIIKCIRNDFKKNKQLLLRFKLSKKIMTGECTK